MSDKNKEGQPDSLNVLTHGAEQEVSLALCLDVGARLLELAGVVLQDVPVSLQGVHHGGARGVLPKALLLALALGHLVVHIAQLEEGRGGTQSGTAETRLSSTVNIPPVLP